MMQRPTTIKYVEAGVALYAMLTGLMFIFIPSMLDHPVYAPWQRLGPFGWGLFMVAVSAAHYSALILNGRNHIMSRTIRAVANTAHIYISLHFAFMFYEMRAGWGVLTFGVLVPWLLWPIAATTINSAQEASYDRQHRTV